PRLDAPSPEPTPAAGADLAPEEPVQAAAPDVVDLLAPGQPEPLPEPEPVPAESAVESLTSGDAELQAWDASAGSVAQEEPAPAAPWDATTDPAFEIPAFAVAAAPPPEAAPELTDPTPALESEPELAAAPELTDPTPALETEAELAAAPEAVPEESLEALPELEAVPEAAPVEDP